MHIANDPGPDFRVNFAANILGCEPRPLREHIAPDGQYRTTGYKKTLGQVRTYAKDSLGIALVPTQPVEPVFAEVLLKMSTLQPDAKEDA